MGIGKIIEGALVPGGNLKQLGKFVGGGGQLGAMIRATKDKDKKAPSDTTPQPMAKGGKTKCYAKGGAIDGCAKRGKTKGRFV